MAAETSSQRLDHAARRLLPALTALALGVVAILPVGIPHWGALAPPLMLIAVFYWSLARPGLMPPTVAFLLGLAQDLLTGAPLGLSALIMVLTQWVMRGQQRYLVKRPFLLLWAAFIPVVTTATLVEWTIYVVFTFQPAPILDALVRLGLGFALFPVVAWLVLIPTHRLLQP
jgi:rod shape-determining protein MreD